MVTDNKIIDNKNLHCKFFEQFILNEWGELSKTSQGLEIARWKVLYWLAVWEKEINDCYDCLGRYNAIREGFHNAGVKLHFEPEVYFK